MMIGRRELLTVLAIAIFSTGLSSCQSDIRVQGAGATFPYPLYQKWFSEYNRLHTEQKLDYQSIGSGAGIKQLLSRTVDFGGSDAPMKDEDLEAAGTEVVHIPTVLGADVITYNLPNVNAQLNLTPEVIAGVFLGKITKWNDAAIAAANPGTSLPAKDLTVVHRSDGSGTTFIFTDYLSKVSPEWKERVGAGTSVSWPVGLGAKGNEGVTGQIKQTPYSIGYVELIYAQQNGLPYASVKNAAEHWIKPSLQSITAAARIDALPDDLRVSITNPPGQDSYPIASFTYILVFKEQQDQRKGRALAEFLWWAIHDGQQMAGEMLYAQLPDVVVKKAEEKIRSMTHGGTPLLTGTP